MASLNYLYNENLYKNIKTLVDRQIEFNVDYPSEAGPRLTVDDQHRAIITEFCLGVYFPLDQSRLGFQIYGNGNNYYHKKNEYITDPKLASELLIKAKQHEPNLTWHIKLALKNDIENPQLLCSNKENEFYVEKTSRLYKVFYPLQINPLASTAKNEKQAYAALINARVNNPIGSQFAIHDPLRCAQVLWDTFKGIQLSPDNYIENSFLHFLAGTSRNEIIEWFNRYFNIPVNHDLKKVLAEIKTYNY